MNTSYKHFTIEERESLLKMTAKGLGVNATARLLKRSASSVSREINRNKNSTTDEYSPSYAHASYKERRKRCVRKQKLDDLQLNALITEKLNDLWSPEQIAGRMKLEFGSSQVSYVTIYRAIYSGRINVSKKCLRRARRGYTPHSTERRGRIHDYRKINERPEEADKRTQNGHWEGDTMRGSRAKGALATFVDRKSSLLVAQVMPDRKAASLCFAMNTAYANFPSELKRTFTVDHGNEFFSFRKIEDDLKTKVYFADPYSSWQRGLNENTNGLLRQYFPKKYDFLKLTQQELDVVVFALNNRPRKKLGFRTPLECFPRF